MTAGELKFRAIFSGFLIILFMFLIQSPKVCLFLFRLNRFMRT